MDERLTILINTCDAYSDVWDLLFASIKQQWPNCPYPFVMDAQNLEYQNPDFRIRTHFHRTLRKPPKKDCWGKRFRETLRDIDTPYVMPWLDDFVLTDPMDRADLIEEVMDFMDANPQVTVVYLHAYPKWCFTLEESEELPGFGKMPNVCSYKLTTGQAIWRRDRLHDLIRDDESPWEWEMFGSFRACIQHTGDFYSMLGGLEDRAHSDIFHVPEGGVIWRGLWHPETEELVKKYGVSLDLSKRGMMDVNNPYREKPIDDYRVREHMKEDFFKKIWWKHLWNHLLQKPGLYKARLRFMRCMFGLAPKKIGKYASKGEHHGS